ncbi:tetratricopeptide repeat protein, partial [Akkermansia sp.]|uniref:tetratricopeptide repeat protein n=1 Tax=Akkermansia sp. TaxID=1872421 RepID=UPI0025C5355E
ESQGRYDEALPLFQQAFQILQKTLGESHPTTWAVLSNTLFCLYKISNSNLDFVDWLQQEFNDTPS